MSGPISVHRAVKLIFRVDCGKTQAKQSIFMRTVLIGEIIENKREMHPYAKCTMLYRHSVQFNPQAIWIERNSSSGFPQLNQLGCLLIG